MRHPRTSRNKLVASQLMHLHTVGEPLLREFDELEDGAGELVDQIRRGHSLDVDIGFPGKAQGQKS